MECLDNRIGILGCDAPSSPAEDVIIGDPNADPPVLPVPAVEALPRFVINSLPGISLTKIDSLANDEQETYLQVWNDIVLRTLAKFDNLVKAEFNKCYKIVDPKIIECLVCENVDLFDLAIWYLHGTETMIEVTSSEVINRWTTIDSDKAEQLKADFYIEFQGALTSAVGSIDVNKSDCIPCSGVESNDMVRWRMVLP